MPSIRVGFCAAALLAGPVLAAEPAVLESGSYEVEVKLELPHLEDTVSGQAAHQGLGQP